jgi:hypothetical protein
VAAATTTTTTQPQQQQHSNSSGNSSGSGSDSSGSGNSRNTAMTAKTTKFELNWGKMKQNSPLTRDIAAIAVIKQVQFYCKDPKGPKTTR